jgi:hypothetical protein
MNDVIQNVPFTTTSVSVGASVKMENPVTAIEYAKNSLQCLLKSVFDLLKPLNKQTLTQRIEKNSHD